MPNWFTRKPVKKNDKANSFDEALARNVRDQLSPVNACKVNPVGGRGSGFAFGLPPLPAISHELVAGSGSGSSVSTSGSNATPDLAFDRYR